MADEIVIDPFMDAEEYVQQFSPEEPGPVYHQDEEGRAVGLMQDGEVGRTLGYLEVKH